MQVKCNYKITFAWLYYCVCNAYPRIPPLILSNGPLLKFTGDGRKHFARIISKI